MDNNIDLNYLLRGHINGTLSSEEKLQLVQFLDNRENLQKWNGLIGKLYEETTSDTADYREEDLEKMIQYILNYAAYQTPAPVLRNRFVSRYWLRYAAVAIIFMGIGSYFYFNRISTGLVQTVKKLPVQQDMQPACRKAILTLSDGRKIELDSSARQTINDGELAIQNKNGTLSYGNSDVIAYNTMSTPKGGQYKVTLPDGTRVWLNAASSISFPTSFPGNSRVVSITGEAYFEVFKNAAKPFTVKTYNGEITVLGTSFNVNSYTDEPGVKTSLLEGSVRIKNIVLKPGQALKAGEIVTTDLDQDLAWKNDVFSFYNVKLVDAMRQISRWYDVEVFYEGKFDDIELGGEIGRNLTLKQVLYGLKDKELHFKLDDKRLTIIQH